MMLFLEVIICNIISIQFCNPLSPLWPLWHCGLHDPFVLSDLVDLTVISNLANCSPLSDVCGFSTNQERVERALPSTWKKSLEIRKVSSEPEQSSLETEK
jgi:hypothetical protein